MLERITAIVIIVFSQVNKLYAQQNMAVSEQLIYQALSDFCQEDHTRKIRNRPLRYVYNLSDCEYNDTCKADGVTEFMTSLYQSDWIKQSFMFFDTTFIRYQIEHPVIETFEKVKGLKIKRSHSYLRMVNLVSVPLFTANKKSAVIVCNYWGMSRAYLLLWHEDKQKWMIEETIWQNGS